MTPNGFPQIGILELLVISAFLTMTFLEELKPWLRSDLHRQLLKKWLDGRKPFEVTQEYDDLVDLAMGGEESSLAKLPTEQLCGQLIVAAEAALTQPIKYEKLLYRLLSGQQSEVKREMFDRDDVKSEDNVKTLLDQLIDPSKGTRSDNFRSAERNQTRSRAMNRIQRRIDAFQVQALNRWTEIITQWKVGIAIPVTTSLMLFANAAIPRTLLGWLIAIFVICPAVGFASSVLRDVIGALQRVNR